MNGTECNENVGDNNSQVGDVVIQFISTSLEVSDRGV